MTKINWFSYLLDSYNRQACVKLEVGSYFILCSLVPCLLFLWKNCTVQEIAPDHTVKLDRIGADIPIVRRHGSSFRRLTLIGSDGSQRHFIVQTSLTPNARSDERILQLFRVMNQMFDKHKESRRRHICIHTPIIIPVWSQVRKIWFPSLLSLSLFC